MIFINKIKGLIHLDYDDDGVSEPGIDFHLHRERFDAVDDGRTNLRQHTGGSMGEEGEKRNLFRWPDLSMILKSESAETAFTTVATICANR